jgi:two-component system invasion response regulator UvrY
MNCTANAKSLSILIVDDHEIVREGLQRILGKANERWRVVKAADAFQALDVLARQPVDVAVVDLNMPGMGGLDLIKRLRTEHPTVTVLVLSMHTHEQYALRAFQAGARGYVTKDGAGTELVDAIVKVANGGAYVPPDLAESVVLRLHGGALTPRHDRLSNREMEVFRRLVGGERLTDIGVALHLSVKTVSTHKARILEKLELPTLAALVRYGIEHGLSDDGASLGGDATA